jgi:flagellar hook assembly protein FlgD
MVRVDVLDVTGRHSRTFADDTRAAGTFELLWDGTDAGGALVPGGVYFVRMGHRGRHVRRAYRPP